ncbi:hypothetical protein AVEN_25445-1, partial [Araneus ventricosus]
AKLSKTTDLTCPKPIYEVLNNMVSSNTTTDTYAVNNFQIDISPSDVSSVLLCVRVRWQRPGLRSHRVTGLTPDSTLFECLLYVKYGEAKCLTVDALWLIVF